MSVKKSEGILKRFIDLKFSAWFTLGSEKNMFCDIWNFFSGGLPVKVFDVFDEGN